MPAAQSAERAVDQGRDGDTPATAVPPSRSPYEDCWALLVGAVRRLKDGAGRSIIANAGSLIGTTGVTSVLGFVYWWLAAHQFPAASVGFAAATVSAMTLLGTIGMLGLGTLLMGELSRHPGKEESLIATALVVAGVAGIGLGVLYALVSPVLFTNLRALATGWASVGLFALGVGLTAITLVFDQAVMGLLRGSLQLGRNTLFSVTKLAALLVVATWVSHGSGLAIYATWALGNLASLVCIMGYGVLRGSRVGSFTIESAILRRLGRTALAHHALNLALMAPQVALPLVVATVVSISTTAYFYTSWMIVGFVFVGPLALTTALYAVNAAEPAALAHRIRLTLGLALTIGLLANGVLFLSAHWVLSLFGHAYAEQATWCLRILGLGIFPLSIKDHYVTISRVRNQLTASALRVTIGGALELCLAGVGAHIGGLSGLSLGWIVAISVEAICMFPLVFKTATSAVELPTSG